MASADRGSRIREFVAGHLEVRMSGQGRFHGQRRAWTTWIRLWRESGSGRRTPAPVHARTLRPDEQPRFDAPLREHSCLCIRTLGGRTRMKSSVIRTRTPASELRARGHWARGPRYLRRVGPRRSAALLPAHAVRHRPWPAPHRGNEERNAPASPPPAAAGSARAPRELVTTGS